ncbi:MAG TPA: tail fiber domain-containing protein [Thermoanaerobaculia bacterium]|nr:tail fiber domain-containing protein [Thermoanaerobaculia bacterium]
MAAFAAPAGKAVGGGSYIEWQLAGGHEKVILTVSAPDGEVYTREYAAGKPVSLSLKDLPNAGDGSYTYQLLLVPKVSGSLQAQLNKARDAGNDAAARALLRAAGLAEQNVVSGAFLVTNGSIVAPDRLEEGVSGATLSANSIREEGPAKVGGGTSARPGTPVVNDQVIPDDLIVQGSGCFGFDCVNNESFGFDTIRLKENNLRIKAEDTSTGSFPTNDWQLTFNDSASGGASKFSVEDITGSKVPFTVTAGASTNSIFIDSTGRVGFRTSTPVLDLHVNTSNTPAIRLEQNNSGGFTAQTWDIAGNEANFFVRDVTGGSKLSFRIRPGAPTSSVDISADGDVGVGTASPSAALHVARSTGAIQEMLLAANNNEARISIQNTGTSQKYIMGVNNTNPGLFFISKDGGGGTIVEVNQRLDGGSVASLKVNGSVQATNVVFSSSRELKNELDLVDGKETLARLTAMPIAHWSLKTDESATKHVGPMAEDFYAAFGVGANNKTISVTDANGVAFSAIQGLAQTLKEKDEELTQLKARMAELEKLVKAQQQ